MTIAFNGAPLEEIVQWTTANTGPGIGATLYSGPARAGFAAEATVQSPAARKGSVTGLVVRTSTPQPGGGSLVLTVRVNGAPTPVVVTIPAGSAAGTFSDLIDRGVFALGDLLSVQAVNNDGGAVSALVYGIALIVQYSR